MPIYRVGMGLLTILKKVKQKEKELRILILGLDNAGEAASDRLETQDHLLSLCYNAGKTTILRKFNGEDINEVYCQK